MKDFKKGSKVTIVSKEWIEKHCIKDIEGYWYNESKCLFHFDMKVFHDNKYNIEDIGNSSEKDNMFPKRYRLSGVSLWWFASWMFKEYHYTFKDKIKFVKELL